MTRTTALPSCGSGRATEVLPQRQRTFGLFLSAHEGRGNSLIKKKIKYTQNTVPRLFCVFPSEAAIWDQVLGVSLWTGEGGLESRFLLLRVQWNFYAKRICPPGGTMEVTPRGDPGEGNAFNNPLHGLLWVFLILFWGHGKIPHCSRGFLFGLDLSYAKQFGDICWSGRTLCAFLFSLY